MIYLFFTLTYCAMELDLFYKCYAQSSLFVM